MQLNNKICSCLKEYGSLKIYMAKFKITSYIRIIFNSNYIIQINKFSKIGLTQTKMKNKKE